MTRRTAFALALSVLAVAFFLNRFARRQDRPPSPSPTEASAREVSDVPSEPASPPPAPTAPPSAPSAVASAAPPVAPQASLDERSLMERARALRGADPAAALQLAREGNARFGDDADAAERTWIVIRSLSDLGRHDEARAEGHVLIEKFHDSSWAQDAYRHLFTNPGTHPFERGYGKVLESD